MQTKQRNVSLATLVVLAASLWLFEPGVVETLAARAHEVVFLASIATITLVAVVLYAMMLSLSALLLAAAVFLANSHSRPWLLALATSAAVLFTFESGPPSTNLATIDYITAFNSLWLICCVVYGCCLLVAKVCQKSATGLPH